MPKFFKKDTAYKNIEPPHKNNNFKMSLFLQNVYLKSVVEVKVSASSATQVREPLFVKKVKAQTGFALFSVSSKL